MPVAADIVNRALDAIGSELVIGELEEGSREAQVCLRAYGPCLEQISRAAHWDCLRKQAPLQLLADATGQTPNVGTLVQIPWTYCYALPIDCMKARFIPWNNYAQGQPGPPGNISIGAQPIMTGLNQPPANTMRIRPARFTISTDSNYPAVTQAISWDQQVEWWEVQGVSPVSRTVILTNVRCANLVYTALIPYPNMWDALFQEAMVALLASVVALPLTKDKKFGMQMRTQQIAVAREKLTQARIADGNEGWYNTDHVPDFIRARNSGAWRAGFGAGWGDGPGVLGYGWDACSFADGSAY
jgi:hypothetical protein